MNPFKLVYKNYLTDHGFSFKETEDGRIEIDEEKMRIEVDLTQGIDVRIFYKRKFPEIKDERRKIGLVEYYASEEGVWFTRPVTEFDEIRIDEIIDLVERHITQLEEMAEMVLQYNHRLQGPAQPVCPLPRHGLSEKSREYPSMRVSAP